MMVGQLLFVDDDTELCQSLTAVLQQARYGVTCLSSAEEALAYIQGGYTDLALVDLGLPDMDGLDLVEKIARLRPYLPVIVLTGRASLDDAVRAIRLGVRDFLLKPIDPDFLLERVGVVLAVRRSQQQKEEALDRIQQLLDQLIEPAATEVAVEEPNRNGRYIYRGDFKLDQVSRTLYCGDKEVILSDTSYRYLMVLMRHAPHAVSFSALVNEAQGYQLRAAEAKNLVFWHVYNLRADLRKLCLAKNYVVNVRGYGYKFIDGTRG